MHTHEDKLATARAGVFRGQFELPLSENGDPLVYLCGHSLGAMPAAAKTMLLRGIEDWSTRAVDGHFEGAHPWFYLGEDLRSAMGSIVGAADEHVALHGTLTTNLHLLLRSFYQPKGKRTKILMEHGAFPSDRFCIRSHVASRSLDPDVHIVTVEGAGPLGVPTTDDLLQAIAKHGDELATILLPGVSYASGTVYDIAKITSAGRDAGAFVGWDLAHAVGNIQLALEADGVDFAAWCTYKYLNGGPGAVAGYFVHPRHTADASQAPPRYEGWWGNHVETRFQPNQNFQAAAGAAAWQLSNVPVFSLLPLYVSLPMFAQVGMERLAELGRESHRYVRRALKEMHPSLQFLTPEDAHGAQLSIYLPQRAEQVQQSLRAIGVLCDTRGTDILRFAAAPLYNHQADLDRFLLAFDHYLDRTEGL